MSAEDWNERKYVTAAQAADFLSVHVRTVYRMAVDGRLRSHYVAGSRAVRFRRRDVERLVIANSDDSDTQGGNTV